MSNQTLFDNDLQKIDIDENKNNIVVKQNDLIDQARYSLSETGIKLVSMLISMIKHDDEDFQYYNVPIKEFCTLTNTSSKNTYNIVHNAINELLRKPIKIGHAQMNFIYYGEYVPGSGNAILCIAPQLKPYLLRLQEGNFTQYYLQDILLLKSGYVIRFYELLVKRWSEHKHYNKSASNFTFELKIDYLRELFEIPSSQLYGDIKRNIIDKAFQQFKERTNIGFIYEEYKVSRKVDRLKITIFDNNKGTNDPLLSLQTFIKYIREYFVNLDLYKVEGKQCISVSPEGRLYDKCKFENSEFEAKRAEALWTRLYDLAKENKLVLVFPRTEEEGDLL